jgi:predicted transcriptional regulator
LSKYGLSPDEYRAKWNLPHDYPMVAPAYSATRSALAKANNLGVTGRTSKLAAPKGWVRRVVKKR